MPWYMKRLILILALGLLVAPRPSLADNGPQAALPEHHRTLLNNHCQKCHNRETQKGKFCIDELPFAITTVEAAEHGKKCSMY